MHLAPEIFIRFRSGAKAGGAGQQVSTDTPQPHATPELLA